MISASRAAIALFGGVWLAYAAWLLSHPVSLPSDDALYFVRGVTRFSVLELSPHFPGYPAFVLAARIANLLTEDPARAVWLVSALSAMSLPVLACAWVAAAGGGMLAAAGAGLGVVALPLLPHLALSMGSDALGLALVMGYLVAIQRKRSVLAGALLGLALTARPSYAVIGAGVFAALAVYRSEMLPRVAAACAGVLAVAFLGLWMADGAAYVDEGARFVRGHFTLWGTAAATPSDVSWLDTSSGLLGGGWPYLCAVVVLAVCLRWMDRTLVSVRSADFALAAYLLWLGYGQNPEHARHAAPILVLAPATVMLGCARAPHAAVGVTLGTVVVLYAGWLTASSVAWTPAVAPLSRVAESSAVPGGAILVTNRGVDVLREARPDLRVFDAYYAGSADYAVRHPGGAAVYRLSGSPLGGCWEVVEELPGRGPGEASLALYRLPSAGYAGKPDAACAADAPAERAPGGAAETSSAHSPAHIPLSEPQS